ncbi:MAG: YHS domain-containing protein [Candidatus Latescibacteria bacterium]|jgi:YHS domain-containing protein|nr:YHS domain-containing protein [Candidatus Latescibacterota bacterium]
MNNIISTILVTFSLLAFSILSGCSKETQPKPEDSTHVHENGTAHEHGSVDEEETADASKSQKICPVMGGKINNTIYADYEGKRTYLCCAACLDEFNKNPEKYINKLEDEGISLDKVPTS